MLSDALQDVPAMRSSVQFGEPTCENCVQIGRDPCSLAGVVIKQAALAGRRDKWLGCSSP